MKPRLNIITLDQILSLVGPLDDSPGDNTARERFREFLRNNTTEVGQVRDYVEECLRTPGQQYARALQDLTNHLGTLLGFQVKFGRYAGVQRQVGFDGLWSSPTGLRVVVEVKTTEAYAIKTSTLLNYINDLISEKEIPAEAEVLGLYVVGRPDAELKQLHAAILTEKKGDRLRIISAESLLALGDLMKDYDISHQDMLGLVRPSTPSIDPIIELIVKLVAEEKTATAADSAAGMEAGKTAGPLEISETSPERSEPAFWLTPVKSLPEQTAEECIRHLVGKEQIYAFGQNTPGRKRIKPGDRIAFYSNGKGVVAHARISSLPENKPHKAVRHSENYPWVFRISDPVLYLDKPVVIDAAARANLDAFREKDLNKGWAWFVQGTGRVSAHDFAVLTRTKSAHAAQQ